MDRVSVDYGGNTYPLYTLLDDHIGAWHRSRQFYEVELLSVLRDLRLDGHYIDVGAHVGNHSVFFRRCTRAEAVTAFEPNPVVLPALLANSRLHGFSCVTHAVYDNQSSLQIVPGPSGNTGMAQARPIITKPDPNLPVAVALPLDYFKFTDVALIKIDVEGAECAVLRSAQRTIERWRPVLVTEAATHEAKAPIADFVTALGYREGGCYCATPTYIWLPQ
jgi:FkbM family methyltransferase